MYRLWVESRVYMTVHRTTLVSHTTKKHLAGSILRKKFTAHKEGPEDITPATYVKLGFLQSVPFPHRTYSKA